MNFEIYFNNQNYSYALGASLTAIEACKSLNAYKTTHKYIDLRRLFVDLSFIVCEGNLYNYNACLSTQILAASVFAHLNNYQRLFVATSVTRIYAKAKYQMPEIWLTIQIQYTKATQKNYNLDEALNAGLVCVDPGTRQILMKAIY